MIVRGRRVPIILRAKVFAADILGFDIKKVIERSTWAEKLARALCLPEYKYRCSYDELSDEEIACINKMREVVVTEFLSLYKNA